VGYEFARDGTELALAEMIKGGVTCLMDMYFFPEAGYDVACKVGIRAVLGGPLLDFPTNYAKTFDEYLAKAVENIESKKNPLVKFAIAPHAPYTVSEDNLEKAWAKAVEHKVPFHIHLHETASEVEDSASGKESMSKHRSSRNCRPLENFKRLGMLGTVYILPFPFFPAFSLLLFPLFSSKDQLWWLFI